MIFAVFLAMRALAADPAYVALERAYSALRQKDYDAAVTAFEAALTLVPKRAAVHKDLAYTLLKIGETEAARDRFAEAVKLDPADEHAALEYAFLCYETRRAAEARDIFDRVRRSANPGIRQTAERAFQNIDEPLREGIERWKRAIELGAADFSAHRELADLAAQRGEHRLAAAHYWEAWKLKPADRALLAETARAWKRLGRMEEANAALLAVSRGGEPRTAEAARELLPPRYPYIYEFRKALELDPGNIELRRELAYLLLKMGRQPEAEAQFGAILAADPSDALSAAQLGFLYRARGEAALAAPLLERAVASGDRELANRVRAVLRVPQAHQNNSSAEAKLMAERSLKAGYLLDALRYLGLAHAADPADSGVILKLGWTTNMLKRDREAIHWFGLAKSSSDPLVAAEAAKAWRGLRKSTAPLHFTMWALPLHSSRWRNTFTYGQAKLEVNTGAFPLKPYVSLRLIGDIRGRGSGAGVTSPQYFSESSAILGLGVRTPYWRGAMAWFEAGSAFQYLHGRLAPDYRGGVSFAGRAAAAHGIFAETHSDSVFLSRFDNDVLGYAQNRAGWAARRTLELYWNANFTGDIKRQSWANFVETGPGVRLRLPRLSESLWLSVDSLRGWYTRDTARYSDIRTGLWYAFTR